jgi:hypothetical protein
MPKLSQRVEATTTVTQQVKLAPKVKQMLKERLIEHAKHNAVVKDLKGTKKKPGRMKRIEKEVEELFVKADQGLALLDGTDVDGYKLKIVEGRTKVFDQLGFMKEHGLSQADFDAYTTYKDNEPYLKITAPGVGDDE